MVTQRQFFLFQAAQHQLVDRLLDGQAIDRCMQVHGGIGLTTDLPIERMWRDARVERIWDGTSEIQRHIINRSQLKPLGA